MDNLYTVSARDLKVGDNIRLTDDHFSKVLGVEPEQDQLIVGGTYNKTATALRIRTLDGTNFLVHPGQLIGVRREEAPAKAKQDQWLSTTMAAH